MPYQPAPDKIHYSGLTGYQFYSSEIANLCDTLTHYARYDRQFEIADALSGVDELMHKMAERIAALEEQTPDRIREREQEKMEKAYDHYCRKEEERLNALIKEREMETPSNEYRCPDCLETWDIGEIPSDNGNPVCPDCKPDFYGRKR